MAKLSDLTIEYLEELIDQKLLEIVGEPDSGVMLSKFLENHETFSGDFKGAFKLRIGDWGVVYTTENDLGINSGSRS